MRFAAVRFAGMRCRIKLADIKIISAWRRGQGCRMRPAGARRARALGVLGAVSLGEPNPRKIKCLTCARRSLNDTIGSLQVADYKEKRGYFVVGLRTRGSWVQILPGAPTYWFEIRRPTTASLAVCLKSRCASERRTSTARRCDCSGSHERTRSTCTRRSPESCRAHGGRRVLPCAHAQPSPSASARA